MNKTEKFIYVLLALLATFVMVDRFMIPCVGIICIMCFLLVSKDFRLRLPMLFVVFLVTALVILVSLGINIEPGFSKLYSLNVAIKELLRVVVYAMVLQMMTMMKVDIKVHMITWKAITVFVVGVAVLQFTKIIDMNRILISIYSYSKQFIYAESNDLSVFRGGSVFVNPNVFACFLVAMLGNYMSTLRITKETLLSKILMFSIVMIGFVLSGSRTGMILGVVLILYHLYTQSKMGLLTFLKNLLLVAVLLAVGVWLMWLIFSIDLMELGGLRMFRVGEGMEDSFGTKLSILEQLIGDMNLLNMLIGYGPFDYAADVSLMVDFDLGYFLTYFGLVGLALYGMFLYGIYSWGDRSLPGRKIRNMIFLIITVVFGLTAGIYFNLRMFTIYLLVFLPALTEPQEGKQLG